MAFIIDNGKTVITKSASGLLDQADFDRQLDVYRLGQRGDGKCRRLWNDFARHNPDMARLVLKFDEADQAERAKAVRRLDAVLSKAERTPPPDPRAAALRAMLTADLSDPDPAVREAARRALAAM